MEQNQRIALITGVSRIEGLGFAIATRLLDEKYRVIITARELDKAKTLADQLRTSENQIEAMQLDVMDEESLIELKEKIESMYGRLDVLINNGAVFLDANANMLTMDLEIARKTFETNFFGIWSTIQHFHSLLAKSDHPRIVNVSSGAGSFEDKAFGMIHAARMVPSYSLSKLSLNGLTALLARQLKADRILINAVCPGFVATHPGMKEIGARPALEAAEGVVWAVDLPDDGPSGKFFRDKKPLEW